MRGRLPHRKFASPAPTRRYERFLAAEISSPAGIVSGIACPPGRDLGDPELVYRYIGFIRRRRRSRGCDRIDCGSTCGGTDHGRGVKTGGPAATDTPPARRRLLLRGDGRDRVRDGVLPDLVQ